MRNEITVSAGVRIWSFGNHIQRISSLVEISINFVSFQTLESETVIAPRRRFQKRNVCLEEVVNRRGNVLFLFVLSL